MTQDIRHHNHMTRDLRPDTCLRCKHLIYDLKADPKEPTK